MFMEPRSRWRAVNKRRQDVCSVKDYNLKRQGRSKKASRKQDVVKQVSYNNGLGEGGHGGEGENWLDSGYV